MSGDRDDELAREIKAHLDLEAEERASDGMSEREARYAALRAFGNVTAIREDAGAVWKRVWLERIVHDVRYALRMFRTSPGFTALAVVTLALGIGANTAMFSVVHAVMLRPLGYSNPDQLMFLTSRVPGFDQFWISSPEYFELTEMSRSFSVIGAFRTGEANLAGSDRPRRVNTADVNVELFEALAVHPQRGRWFRRDELRSNGPALAILSHDLWRSAFGTRADIIGHTIDVNGVRREVVGVMPEGYDLMDKRIDVWLPLPLDGSNRQEWNRATHNLYALGRLKDDVTPAAAAAELETLVVNWADRTGASHVFGRGGHIMQMEPVKHEIVGSAGRALWVLQAAVGFVLLIACTNLASLLMVRAEIRGRELAVRTAIGAGWTRLLTQFTVEGVALSSISAVAGVALAWVGIQSLTAAYAEGLPRAAEIAINPTVLGFALTAATLTGVTFGLVPLLHVPHGQLSRSLNETGARGATSVRHRVRRTLVAVQVAVAVVLVVGAALMVRTVVNLLNVEGQFDREHLVTFGVELPWTTYGTFTQKQRLYTRLTERLNALPGVRQVSILSGLPPSRQFNVIATDVENSTAPLEGRPYPVVDYYQTVTIGALETMGIPIVRGRTFQPTDRVGAPVVIVNETFASKFWLGLDPIGHRVRSRFGGLTTWATVVGVAKDVKQGGVDQNTGTELYYVLDQIPRIFPAWVMGNWDGGDMKIVMRTDVPAATVLPTLTAAVREVDASLPLIRPRVMDDVIRDSVRRPRMLMQLFVGFAGLALFLAAIGIYGVLSYMVTERRREIAIRMALGATRQSVLRAVAGHGLTLAGIGLVAGLASAVAMTRLMKTLLFEVEPNDPATLVSVAVGVMAVAAAATMLPAHRATRIDPMVALQGDN